MKGINNNLTGRPYCKKKERSQEGYQEETTQTSMQGQLMRKMTIKDFSQKFNNKKASYHSVGT
jgi:hypothetical protein